MCNASGGSTSHGEAAAHRHRPAAMVDPSVACADSSGCRMAAPQRVARQRSRIRAWVGAAFLSSWATSGAPLAGLAHARPLPGLEGARVTASARQLDLRTRAGLTFVTDLPVPARERITILDAGGVSVFTLVDLERPAGRYSDAWDGRGQRGQRLRDGLYTWVATFSSGGEVLTIDLSADTDGGAEVKAHPDYDRFDPFRNVPLRFQHTFDEPCEIGLVFSPSTYARDLSCDVPNFCRWIEEFQPAGPFVYEWAGVDDTGALREDIHAIYVVCKRDQLSRNAIVLYGGRPRVQGVSVSPSYYRPELGEQQLTFSLDTYGGERVAAEVAFTNQQSRSALRTLRLGEVASGTVTARWNGRGDNGERVAPGSYTVSVTVSDALGHRAGAQILTVVDY